MVQRKNIISRSQVGREVLMNVVVQAIPTYDMGCFKFPIGIFHEIEALIN